MPLSWACGVTTVPERRETTLPKTLESLKQAGFTVSRLAVDGTQDWTSYQAEASFRFPRIGAWGSWITLLLELHLREPNADRYLMVQDDVVFCRNVKTYLERTIAHSLRTNKQWFNLYTFDQNEQVIAGKPTGWHAAAELTGQGGNGRQVNKGALALVFSNACVEALLSHPSIVGKCRGSRAKTNIDGSVGGALNQLGWREMIHNPSLVDHIGGDCSIIEKQIEKEVELKQRAHVRGVLPKCQSFRGTEFDCLELLR